MGSTAPTTRSTGTEVTPVGRSKSPHLQLEVGPQLPLPAVTSMAKRNLFALQKVIKTPFVGLMLMYVFVGAIPGQTVCVVNGVPFRSVVTAKEPDWSR
jgi:hypothetical protein